MIDQNAQPVGQPSPESEDNGDWMIRLWRLGYLMTHTSEGYLSISLFVAGLMISLSFARADVDDDPDAVDDLEAICDPI